MSDPTLEFVTLGGGCYWCMEAVFELLEGVSAVTSGASGGHVANPTYEELCTGETGHAEVVQLQTDPSVTSFREVLDVFFSMHDPTTLNCQGGDVGTQYRSVIFYHTSEQEETARAVIGELTTDGLWRDPIVTEVVPFERFYRAEDYHQGYFRKNGQQPYCRVIIGPKVTKLRARCAHKLKTQVL